MLRFNEACVAKAEGGTNVDVVFAYVWHAILYASTASTTLNAVLDCCSHSIAYYGVSPAIIAAILGCWMPTAILSMMKSWRWVKSSAISTRTSDQTITPTLFIICLFDMYHAFYSLHFYSISFIFKTSCHWLKWNLEKFISFRNNLYLLMEIYLSGYPDYTAPFRIKSMCKAVSSRKVRPRANQQKELHQI